MGKAGENGGREALVVEEGREKKGIGLTGRCHDENSEEEKND